MDCRDSGRKLFRPRVESSRVELRCAERFYGFFQQQQHDLGQRMEGEGVIHSDPHFHNWRLSVQEEPFLRPGSWIPSVDPSLSGSRHPKLNPMWSGYKRTAGHLVG